MTAKELYARKCEQKHLVLRTSSAEAGTRLRQRCQDCGRKFKSTQRVVHCPITSGCRGRTIVLGEE